MFAYLEMTKLRIFEKWSLSN